MINVFKRQNEMNIVRQGGEITLRSLMINRGDLPEVIVVHIVATANHI
jgi:hypothetical protein